MNGSNGTYSHLKNGLYIFSGEKIGIEYLLSQASSGGSMQGYYDPDNDASAQFEPEIDADVPELEEDVDEGFVDVEVDDLTCG